MPWQTLYRSGLIASLTLLHIETAAARSLGGASGFVEFQLAQTTDHEDSDQTGVSRLSTRAELAPSWSWSPGWSLQGTLVLESLRDAPADDDQWLGHEGVFVEEFKLVRQEDHWQVTAGKFNPTFGTAWDDGRGIWSRRFAEDYEITERWGLELGATGGAGALGDWSASLSGYVADTSGLSGAAITSRPRLRRADGGPANTRHPKSATASLGLSGLLGIEHLTITAALRHQSAADASPEASDENGYAVTVEQRASLGPGMDGELLLEYADIQHFDTTVAHAQWLTTGVLLHAGTRWQLALSQTRRSMDDAAHDRLTQVSAGYRFNQAGTLEFGWRSGHSNGEHTDRVGIRWQRHFELGQLH